jgi:hypothetical protein
LAGEALGTDLAKVVELQEDGKTLLVRTGVGWKAGVVGVATITAEDDTSEGHALQTGEARTNETAKSISRHTENRAVRFPQKSAKIALEPFRCAVDGDDVYSESGSDRIEKSRYSLNGKPRRIGGVYGNLG